MPSTDFLCFGQPSLPSDGPATKAAPLDRSGWLQRLERLGPAGACAGVHGSFGVGLRDDVGRVFLGVDPFAGRSMCWREVGATVQFAERADELADGATTIDLQSIFDYLYFHVIPSPRTIFRGVHRLPPGHYLWHDGARLTIARYWTPDFTASTAPRPDFESLREEFRALLLQAVRRQLDGTKPACYLSGGTDSSTVAGLIGQAAGRPAATYSIGFEAAGYDEMAYARTTARHFGTEHHEYYVTPDDLIGSMADVAAAYDQPFGNSSVLPAFHCARVARESGVTRLLAGDGGDELFGGNTRYAKQRLFAWYDHLPQGLRSHVIEPGLDFEWMDRVPPLRKARSYVEQARVPMPDRMQMYNLLGRLGPRAVLTDGFLDQVDVGAPRVHQRQTWSALDGAGALDRQLAFDWRYTLAECDLPKVRGSAELAGVDPRFPLLDLDLVAFSLRLPASYKLRGSKLRWFFKEALRGFLPDETIVKRKQGFGLPFGVWAARHAPLRELASDALRSLSARGIVRQEFVQALLTELLPSHPGYYGEMVWILTMLELWLQRHAPDWRLDA